MGQTTEHKPVLLMLTLFSRHPAAIDWGLRQATTRWGPPMCVSDPFDFAETDYYQGSMGPSLALKIAAFQNRIMPSDLVQIKHATNALEHELAAINDFPENRPLNMDPGYLTPAKFVLATTKDMAHRLYLDDGIYGEITLKYFHGSWVDLNWTYPNYRRPDYKAFLDSCRNLLMSDD